MQTLLAPTCEPGNIPRSYPYPIPPGPWPSSSANLVFFPTVLVLGCGMLLLADLSGMAPLLSDDAPEESCVVVDIPLEWPGDFSIEAKYASRRWDGIGAGGGAMM